MKQVSNSTATTGSVTTGTGVWCLGWNSDEPGDGGWCDVPCLE